MIKTRAFKTKKTHNIACSNYGKNETKGTKIKGSIKNKNINLSRLLNLFVYPVKNLIVAIVDGQQVKQIGRYHKVSVQIQSLKLQMGCYAPPLNGMDMVLGEEWLMQMGTYATNLQEQFMEFKWQGKNYKLYGSGSQNRQLKELTNLTLFL
jgi:hypothetical protein